jgi:hypothetical protein
MQAAYHPSIFPQTVEEERAVGVLAEAGVSCRGFLREVPSHHLILFDDSRQSTLALKVPAVLEGGADLVGEHLEKSNARWSR